jgi:hypothetical protein
MPSSSVVNTYRLVCKLHTGPAVLGLGRDTATGQLHLPALQHLQTMAPNCRGVSVPFPGGRCMFSNIFRCLNAYCARFGDHDIDKVMALLIDCKMLG